MKILKFVLTICAVVLFIGSYAAYPKDDASLGVTVFGPTEKGSPKIEANKTEPSNETVLPESGTPKTEFPGQGLPEIKSYGRDTSSRLIYNLIGSKIGGVKVSESVTLPSEGEIIFVDTGVTRAFIIVRVDTAGRETLALNISPDRAVGQRLPKGTYKVYPLDLDEAFPLEKLTVRIQIGLVESKIGDSQ